MTLVKETSLIHDAGENFKVAFKSTSANSYADASEIDRVISFFIILAPANKQV